MLSKSTELPVALRTWMLEEALIFQATMPPYHLLHQSKGCPNKFKNPLQGGTLWMLFLHQAVQDLLNHLCPFQTFSRAVLPQGGGFGGCVPLVGV